MKTETASTNTTPLSALTTILTGAVNTAEWWVDDLELRTFPCDTDDWDVLSAHPSITIGWHWEDWDALVDDNMRCEHLLRVCKGCVEVEPLTVRLERAMKLINSFMAVAGEHTDEFCR